MVDQPNFYTQLNGLNFLFPFNEDLTQSTLLTAPYYSN
jgi:hypothetical protein